jgi:porin
MNCLTWLGLFGSTALPSLAIAEEPLASAFADETRTEPSVERSEPAPRWFERTTATGDWAGGRPWLEEHGVAFAGSYSVDGSVPLTGGLTRRGAARGLLDLELALDTEPLVGLHGGSLAARFLHHHGRNGSDDVGDLQAFSNIDGDPFSKLYELWYQQEIFGGKLRVKAGQVDANTEFAVVDTGADLLSSSAGFSPTILGFPTYPDPRLAVNVFIHPTEHLYLGGGIYGSSLEQSFDFAHPFWIGEIGFAWDRTGGLADGRVALGIWHDTAPTDRFDGTTQSGTRGFYVVAEQRLWTENPDADVHPQGIDGFLQYGRANGSVSPFTHHVGVGLRGTGLVPSRHYDTLNVGANWTRRSEDPAAGFTANEWSVEINYAARITPFFRLVPDLQWIGHPGGDASRSGALVATLRTVVVF